MTKSREHRKLAAYLVVCGKPTMSRTALFVAAVAACLVASAYADVCVGGATLTKNGASFDVSALMRTGATTPDFEVTGGDIPCTETVEKNYTYVFDVCADVEGSNYPQICKDQGKTGPALQFDPSGQNPECYTLGRTGALELINENDPTQGVQLTYTGGDQCQHQGSPYRQVTLVFGCADNAYPVPTVANEVAHCMYTVAMPSIYGCPLECPVAGDERKLCAGHGICGYDRSNSKAKCFCDTGFGGADCNTAVDESTSGGNGAIIGLLVTVLLIALVLGVVLFFVIRMLRAYRQDAHNYMAMHNQDLGTHDI